MNIQPVRILIASVLCSVLILFWGFIYWALLPTPAMVHKTAPAEQAKELHDPLAKMEQGTYIFPTKDSGESQTDFQERLEAGHVYMVSLVPKGINPMPNITFLQAFVHGLAACVIVGFLLSMVRGSLCCYSHRRVLLLGCSL